MNCPDCKQTLIPYNTLVNSKVPIRYWICPQCKDNTNGYPRLWTEDALKRQPIKSQQKGRNKMKVICSNAGGKECQDCIHNEPHEDKGFKCSEKTTYCPSAIDGGAGDKVQCHKMSQFPDSALVTGHRDERIKGKEKDND